MSINYEWAVDVAASSISSASILGGSIPVSLASITEIDTVRQIAVGTFQARLYVKITCNCKIFKTVKEFYLSSTIKTNVDRHKRYSI